MMSLVPPPSKKQIEELQQHPELFEATAVRREDGLDDICVVRKETGEIVAQNLANALVQIDEHPELFYETEGVDGSNNPIIQVIRKLTGEVAVNRYGFSKRNR